MATITYEQAYADHKALWAIGPANDMTGGYVDQDDLALMLEHPTRTTARTCLVRQIEYWFSQGTEDGRRYQDLVRDFPELEEIRNRYC